MISQGIDDDADDLSPVEQYCCLGSVTDCYHGELLNVALLVSGKRICAGRRQDCVVLK